MLWNCCPGICLMHAVRWKSAHISRISMAFREVQIAQLFEGEGRKWRRVAEEMVEFINKWMGSSMNKWCTESLSVSLSGSIRLAQFQERTNAQDAHFPSLYTLLETSPPHNWGNPHCTFTVKTQKDGLKVIGTVIKLKTTHDSKQWERASLCVSVYSLLGINLFTLLMSHFKDPNIEKANLI